ncbi:MAG: hypothetical protein KGK17_05440 [Betaproteobacteria bacterium]|nr:hypothetical protein [Betaproteobacteria bacterium]
MNMKTEKITLAIALAGLITSFVFGALSFFVGWHSYERGQDSPKNVGIRFSDPQQPLYDINRIGGNVSFELKDNERPITNLVSIQTKFANTGTSAIRPSDYAENLSITVNSPWKIIAIENPAQNFQNIVHVEWRKISSNKFEAQPILLNPGELIYAEVFCTNPTLIDNNSVVNTPAPEIKWNGHITNLDHFSYPENPVAREVNRLGGIGIIVELSGKSLVFFIVAFSVCFLTFLILMKRAVMLNFKMARTYFFVLMAALFSQASSEAESTYIFGSLVTDIYGIPNALNIGIIVLNFCVLLALFIIGVVKVKSNNSEILFTER